jgi:hypothetical protein
VRWHSSPAGQDPDVCVGSLFKRDLANLDALSKSRTGRCALTSTPARPPHGLVLNAADGGAQGLTSWH